MSKRNKILMLSLVLVSVSLAHAQGLFQMGKKPEKTIDTTLSAPSKTIMAPDDFNSAVTDLNKQNQAAFKKQVDQKVAQVGSAKVQPAPDVPKSKNSSPSDSASPIPEPIPDEEPAAPTPTQDDAASKKPSTTSNSAAPSTTQPQTYTGFTGSGDSGSSSGSSGSGGNSNKGWSIKY